jgi:hypothetical protein
MAIDRPREHEMKRTAIAVALMAAAVLLASGCFRYHNQYETTTTPTMTTAQTTTPVTTTAAAAPAPTTVSRAPKSGGATVTGETGLELAPRIEAKLGPDGLAAIPVICGYLDANDQDRWLVAVMANKRLHVGSDDDDAKEVVDYLIDQGWCHR